MIFRVEAYSSKGQASRDQHEGKEFIYSGGLLFKMMIMCSELGSVFNSVL